MTDRPSPLADIRIISVEQYGAGPYGTLHLADLGAEVIKIEDPSSGGDISRYVPPFAEETDSVFFEAFNRNKKSVSLDLRSESGRSVFEALVKNADVVYSNLRGDVPKKLRLTYDDLKDVNPKIVCCSLSGFGMTGPRAAEPAYDYIIQGMAGWMSITGEPGGPPTKSGLSLVDFCGGFVAAQAVLAGVHAARRDGVGMDCDVSLFDTAIGLLTYVGAWSLTGEFTPTRRANSAHPSMVPFQNFQTKDGWIVVACAKQKFWERLAETVGRADLATDPKFIDYASRRKNEGELLPQLDEALLQRPTDEWITLLTAAGVPCGRVNEVGEALEDPQTIARELIVEVDHERFGKVRTVASPVRVGSDRPTYRRGPFLGEDTARIVSEVGGFSDSEIEKLAEAGAFGPKN